MGSVVSKSFSWGFPGFAMVFKCFSLVLRTSGDFLFRLYRIL